MGWVLRLREVLDGRGIGHKRLAAEIQELNGGVIPGGGTAENLRAYRKGAVRNPRPAVIRLVAQALGVRFEWLMDGENPMTAEEGRASELARQYGEGLPGAEAQLKALHVIGGHGIKQGAWDAEAVTPAYFLTWRRLVQLRSPSLTDKAIREVGLKLTMHLMAFLAVAGELNGGKSRSVKWHTDVALAWLSAVAVTVAWDQMEEVSSSTAVSDVKVLNVALNRTPPTED